MNFIHRLDFTGFYTAQLEQCTTERSRMEAGQGEMGEGGASMMWFDMGEGEARMMRVEIDIPRSIHLEVQWNFIIKRSDITKPSYNKVILLVPALYSSLFLYPDMMRNLI